MDLMDKINEDSYAPLEMHFVDLVMKSSSFFFFPHFAFAAALKKTASQVQHSAPNIPQDNS